MDGVLNVLKPPGLTIMMLLLLRSTQKIGRADISPRHLGFTFEVGNDRL